MVSRYTTLVPPLRLCIGPAREAGLSTGMQRGHVPPRKKEGKARQGKEWKGKGRKAERKGKRREEKRKGREGKGKGKGKGKGREAKGKEREGKGKRRKRKAKEKESKGKGKESEGKGKERKAKGKERKAKENERKAKGKKSEGKGKKGKEREGHDDMVTMLRPCIKHNKLFMNNKYVAVTMIDIQFQKLSNSPHFLGHFIGHCDQSLDSNRVLIVTAYT